MGVEKQGSKGVGGFFQLFDWNAKSRKKLFSSKSDLTEQSKQKKRSDGNLPMTWLHPMDEDEFVERSSFKGCSDYSCASSVTDEEGYLNRAPGVVARLMGLDSLPTSNFVGPYSTPFSDSQSLRDANLQRKNLEDLNHDYQIMHSGGNIRNRVEAPVRNSMEPKLEKMKSRPIEKFQTEILPPKSAKSIPLTHHKLLSPIKSPGFVPSKNAAHIMEAAAKIIEPGPQASSTKAKMPLVGSSSVPLKVRDLKEKAEASRRPVESSAAKYLKGQSMNRSCNGSVDTRSLAVSSDSEDRSTGSKNNGKSISLALQAKVNVQKREGLNPSSSRGLFGQKEQKEVMTSHLFKSQPNLQKSKHKKSTESSSNVLKPNNQKQNCAMDREKLLAKPSASNSQSRKALSGDSSSGRHKNSSKVGSRKLGIEVVDNKKELPYSRTNNVSRKKRSIDGSFHFEKTQAVDSMLIDKTDKPIESRSVTDRQFSWAEGGKRKGTDVVSFTFTAPMTRSILDSEISRQIADKATCFSSDSTNSAKSSSLRHNVIGGDALSILLEQKLRELTHGIESSHRKTGSAGSSSNSQDLVVPDFEALNSTSMLHDKRSHDGTYIDKLGSQFRPNFSSTDPHGFIRKYKLQGVEDMDECSSNGAEVRKFLDRNRYPSPISVLEPSFFSESCNSSNTTDSSITEGGKQCSSVHAQEVVGMFSLKKFHSMEADAELSDSASSTSTRTVARTHVFVTDYVGSTSWELEYVKEILCNVELMFKDFTVGQAREIINPNLFNQLESKKRAFRSHGEEEPKVRRKVIFDCVSECMDVRCRRYKDGGSKTWAKGVSMVRRKEWLAEEVYKEILGWRGLGDCMVDELVDRDMSSQNGRWLDFEVEAFELGVEIENRILSSLIDEVVDDILLL